MTAPRIYHEHHPRWLRKRVSTYWWLGKWAYVKFILRESSSVFVAWFVIELLMLAGCVAASEESFRWFVAWTRTPVVLAVNVLAFFFVLFHALTWFALAPKAIVAYLGRTRVPAALIAASNYGAWLVVSAAVWWLLQGG